MPQNSLHLASPPVPFLGCFSASRLALDRVTAQIPQGLTSPSGRWANVSHCGLQGSYCPDLPLSTFPVCSSHTGLWVPPEHTQPQPKPTSGSLYRLPAPHHFLKCWPPDFYLVPTPIRQVSGQVRTMHESRLPSFAKQPPLWP